MWEETRPVVVTENVLFVSVFIDKRCQISEAKAAYADETVEYIIVRGSIPYIY